MTIDLQDLELLNAVRDYTLQHSHADLAAFKPPMQDWGDTWQAVAPASLPVAEILKNSLAECSGSARELAESFVRHNARLRWEQSYRKQDGLVPDAMLEGYGFAEIIGQRGPFVSERIRAGIGVWGPHIDYPLHHHTALEIYDVLCGSMQFRFDDDPPKHCGQGDVVLVESERRHGFSTGSDHLVVFYLWQAGDLRQTSRFGEPR